MRKKYIAEEIRMFCLSFYNTIEDAERAAFEYIEKGHSIDECHVLQLSHIVNTINNEYVLTKVLNGQFIFVGAYIGLRYGGLHATTSAAIKWLANSKGCANSFGIFTCVSEFKVTYNKTVTVNH